MMAAEKTICMWIACMICLLGERLKMPTVEAVATFDYYDDHEQLSYDLDTEQSKAKYDTRILTQQLKSEVSTSTDVQTDKSYANSYSNRAGKADENVAIAAAPASASDNDDVVAAANSYTVNHDSSYADVAADSSSYGSGNFNNNNSNKQNADDDDEVQPHERAASCYTGGHKYTHGQKVPRYDPCEVCLCMDGEIFCWWEKCNKNRHQSTMTTSTPTSTERTSNRRRTTAKGKHQTHHHQHQHHEHSIETTTKHLRSKATKNVAHQKYHQPEDQQEETNAYRTNTQMHSSESRQQKPSNKISKNWIKLKAKQEQAELAQYKFKEQNFINHKMKPPKEAEVDHTQELQQPQQHPHNRNNRQHELDYAHYMASAKSRNKNKILNFPENLPSILYSDYKTEEHEHLQHQHHQKHLQHQQMLQQKKQHQHEQHEHQQTQQNGFYLEQWPDQRATTTKTTTTAVVRDTTKATTTTHAAGIPSATFSISTEFENVYDDLDTDSDILPEPPTKRPGLITTAAVGISTQTNILEGSSGLAIGTNASGSDGADQSGSDYVATPAVYRNINENSSSSFTAKTINAEDDAFHRWLTSTETNNDDDDDKNSNSSISKTSTNTRSHHFNEQYYDDFNKDNNNTTMPTAENIEKPTITTFLTKENDESNNSNDKKNNQNNAAGTNQNDNNNNRKLSGTSDEQQHTQQQSLADELKQLTQNSENSAILRSTLNEYNNGSLINIDISLVTTAEDEEQQKQLAASNLQEAQLMVDAQATTTTTDAYQQKLNTNCNNNKTTTLLNSVHCAGVSVSDMNSTRIDAGSTADSALNSQDNKLRTTSNAQKLHKRQCNVMGTIYNIGDVLPQDTGNCLQCVCSESYNKDDTPRVTCSPHNCPPLVLPDLLDASGY